MDRKDMMEELEDIKNIGQMLEISLQANEDDPNIIKKRKHHKQEACSRDGESQAVTNPPAP